MYVLLLRVEGFLDLNLPEASYMSHKACFMLCAVAPVAARYLAWGLDMLMGLHTDTANGSRSCMACL